MGPETILIAGALAGAAASAIGTIQTYQQQGAAAARAEADADILEQNAEQRRREALVRESSLRRRQRATLARQRAAVSASGLEGASSMALYGQSAVEAELDAMLTRYGGEMEARGLTAQAGEQRWRARSTRAQRGGTLLGGFVGAGAQAMSGVTSYRAATRVPSMRPQWSFGSARTMPSGGFAVGGMQ